MLFNGIEEANGLELPVEAGGEVYQLPTLRTIAKFDKISAGQPLHLLW
jgi:hypothetical protein